MDKKIIHFIIGDHRERAEFHPSDSSEEIKDIFRSAAEAGPNDILKLYNDRENLINISSKIPSNSASNPYRLEVVARYCEGHSSSPLFLSVTDEIEQRLQKLENKVFHRDACLPPNISEMKEKVDTFTTKLENVEHLSWLGLTKDLSCGPTSQLFWKRTGSIHKTQSEAIQTYENFLKLSHIEVVDEVREQLKKATFDNWQWEDSEMMLLLRQMFIDLNFINKFKIEMPVLHKWLYTIYRSYNEVPFHNFKHCFMVTQMMYGLMWVINLQKYLDDVEVIALLTTAICHDLDHPGYNNAYQINAKTELAIRYNDISPLENHHCSVAFEILEDSTCNIFRNVPRDVYKRLRDIMIRCILATDMAKHSEILADFRSVIPIFDFNNKQHTNLLMMILIKVSDISNEARPLDVAMPWLDCLLEEFFNQSDVEKLEGLPVAPFMDREKVSKSSSQIGFIKFVMLPLFESLAQLFPVVEEHVVIPVRKALEYYTDMQSALDEQKRRDGQTNSGLPGCKNGLTNHSLSQKHVNLNPA